ncbi:hypothetical protein [Aestuariivirga sp.]|uniref:hypothetical protein n=1 Tax=Aestuariivirga sp. TaxID=2650926 RepID=UPI0039E3B901
MIETASLIEERLSEQAQAALKPIVGKALAMRTPWAASHGDGGFYTDRILLIKSVKNDIAEYAQLEICELDAPFTEDHLYRYSLSEHEKSWAELTGENPSSWVYRNSPEHNPIRKIEIYSYISISNQMKAWPHLEKLEEVRSYDYEILFCLENGRQVSIRPMHNWNLIEVSLTPSFEIPHSKMRIGDNLNLRLTIN